MLIQTTFFEFAAARYVGDDVEPDYRQMLLEQQAIGEAAALRETMSKLAVRQQTALLRAIRAWGVFIDARPASEPSTARTGSRNGTHHKHESARTGGTM